jgi:hypothetical protein
MAIEILSVTPSEMPGGGNLVYEYQGLSTDTKPTTGVGEGSTFTELDTGDFWQYSVENENPATSNGWWK